MRVLDAFWPRGATWSGQVISSPPGPSGGPSKTHLLPGGGVPRVHRARSPVPPRLPLFATPWSVHQFAAVAAGAYPLRRPPNAWSPGVPALPGPCYWLVASGTPVGWRGGCLALGLVRGAVRHYCLGGCSALVVCARRSRPVRGGWGRCLVLCLPRFPLPAPRFLRLCVAGRPVRVSLILARWYAIPCGLCVPRARSGCPCVFPRVSFVFVCARALAASAPPPPLPGFVWRAHLARSRCWALVGPFHSVRAPPRVLPRPRAPFGLLGGGAARSRFPLPGLGLRAPRGVGAGVGTRHQPHSARSCELALRAVGAARGRPGGAPLAWVWGVRGRALSHPRPLALWACGRGPLPTGCGCGGVRAWGPVTNPTARALANWLCALWGRHKDARGGRLLPGCGASGVGRSTPPTTRPLGVRPGPTTHWLWVWGGAGVGTRHQPHSARSCELALRAVGAARGRPGGASLAWVWGVRGRALSHPRPLALWACGRGPLPTGCGCGGVRAWGPVANPTARALSCWLCALWGRHEGARGGRLLPGCGAPGVGRSPTPDHSPSGRVAGAHYRLAVVVGGCGRGDPSPTPQRALLRAGFARCGGGTRAPGGGASCLGVGRLVSGALPPPTTRPLGVRPGPTTHWLWVWGGAGVGTRHQPHSARSCELALRAVGAARGRPGGAPLAWVWGAWCRALSHPRPLALWACGRGPLPTGCGCGGVRAWGPVINPTARALASWLCALWGRHEGARGGRLLPGCGAPGVGRSPTPDHSPSGRAAGAHYPLAVGVGGCGRGDPSPTPLRALLRAGFARCGGGTRTPGGGASCLGVGRLVSGALPPPTTPPLGVRPGPTTHWLWVWGGAGVGTRHQPHSARSCELALRAVGAARGRPGGAPLAWVWGARGRALSHPRPLALWACGRGPLPTGCGCGGVRAWGPVTNPTARALASWLCALWGRHEGARGGRLLPGCGAPGVGRSPTPDLSSFRACGRGPLPTGRGCGVRAWGPGSPWHLPLCRGSLCVVCASRVRGTRWPLWLGTCSRAVVVAGGVPLWRALWPRVGAPRLVRSGRSRCSGGLSRRRGAFPHPGGLRPRIYWAAARGTWRPAENRALCACRWPPPKQGRWARSASYPFGAPRWGCPWRVPPASVLGCVRCGCLRVWTRSLTRPVSRTVRRSTGDSTGALGLFRVDADTAPFGSEDATPGSRACVGVRALLGRVGRAGLPGAFWCASPSPVAAFGALLVCLAPSGLGLPCLWLLLFFFSFFFFFLFLCFLFPRSAPVVSGFPCFPAPGALGLGASGPPTPPPPFFFFSFFLPLCFFFLFCAALCVLFRGFRAVVPWALASVVPPPGPPVCFPFFFCGFFSFPIFCFFFSCSCFFFFCVVWLLPGCACSVCVVACLVAVSWCVLCFARCCVVCLCWAWCLPRAAAPCCRRLAPVVARGCVLPGVRCCVALFVCRAVWCCLRCVLLVVPRCFVRAGWCCVLLPVVAGCSLLGLVACCCFPLACVVAVAPVWPLPCCVLWFVVVPRSSVLCSVFCGAVSPCGAVLCRPAVRFPLLVVLVCVPSLPVRCCVVLRVVSFGAGLVCAVVGASCCGVSLCVVAPPFALCGLVVLLWCVVGSCCAVLCSAVLCRLAVPCCCGALCVVLCCGCSLFF